MAKKKNTIKSSQKTLRQALLSVKTAIIHFSEDHIVSIWYNPSSKETVVTDIPQNLSSQFTLGESGGSAPTPVLDVKLVITEESPDVTLISATYVITNNIYDYVQWTGDPIAPGEYHYLLPVFYNGNEDTGYESYLPFATSDSYYGESSDLNNCTIQDAVVTVTDPTQNASITITFDAV